MVHRSIIRGWDLWGLTKRTVKRTYTNAVVAGETRETARSGDAVAAKICDLALDQESGRRHLAETIAGQVLQHFAGCEEEEVVCLRYFEPLASTIANLIPYEGWFDLPGLDPAKKHFRSELWDAEDEIRRTETIIDEFDDAVGSIANAIASMVGPIVEACPQLLEEAADLGSDISFPSKLIDAVFDLPELVERVLHVPFAPDYEDYDLWPGLKTRLEYNLIAASGGIPGEPDTYPKSYRLPTKAPQMGAFDLVSTYLGQTPLLDLLNVSIPLIMPTSVRFEHHHMVAGSGHGKTQTLQYHILKDLEAVAAGERSIIVMDSQSDLINNIAGLKLFAPGQPLADRLVVIDPTDVEWPVALNLFDMGIDRLDSYSQLDRERLLNGILELYDFVLGSLLDARMTQKQSVIFRYITRLMMQIPNATIHTFKEVLSEDGFAKYQSHVTALEGSARSFFEQEYQSREYVQTRKQVLRRLYGILENQTFERMFSHPKSKLDLFSEMNAGKVILINTAKDLLKSEGTEIFGRFFIAMIAQAAQERAVLPKDQRLPTFVYVDEADDYFDQNIGVILSQARKYSVGMILAHQYLGQLDTKLQEAIAANTAIKFAGGVSAKDTRALASDLRTDASFIERLDRLTFAAFIKGQTKQAAAISITPGLMEAQPRMTHTQRDQQRAKMRQQYAVHYTEISAKPEDQENGGKEPPNDKPPDDDGSPMKWE